MFYYIMFLHWIADFVFQSHWMAINKSKKIKALLLHVITYAITLGCGLIFLDFSFEKIFLFVLINFVLHISTDYFTSKANSYFYEKEDHHNFFVVVGFDQFIHFACLASTTELILTNS